MGRRRKETGQDRCLHGSSLGARYVAESAVAGLRREPPVSSPLPAIFDKQAKVRGDAVESLECHPASACRYPLFGSSEETEELREVWIGEAFSRRFGYRARRERQPGDRR